MPWGRHRRRPPAKFDPSRSIQLLPADAPPPLGREAMPRHRPVLPLAGVARQSTASPARSPGLPAVRTVFTWRDLRSGSLLRQRSAVCPQREPLERPQELKLTGWQCIPTNVEVPRWMLDLPPQEGIEGLLSICSFRHFLKGDPTVVSPQSDNQRPPPSPQNLRGGPQTAPPGSPTVYLPAHPVDA